jgi:hypothetical protein
MEKLLSVFNTKRKCLNQLEEGAQMSKLRIATFCIVSLFVMSLLGSVAAPNFDYTHTLYQSDNPPTIDGTYIMGAEWGASLAQPFGTNGVWRDEWTMSPNYACLLIETADTTDDEGDYWVVCYDSTDAGGATEPDGGAAPQSNDYKLVVTGHGTAATVQWYKGTGTGWTSVTPDGSLLTQAQSLTATPILGTPHHVLEILIDKADTSLGTVPMGYNWAQYVAYDDAHDGGFGLQSWPPASADPSGSEDVPDSWGYIQYAEGANPEPDVPEGIGIVAALSLSSFAIVGVLLLRKRRRVNS